jgi:hypothetical protein
MMQRNPLSGVASALKAQAGAKSFLAKEAEEEALRDDKIWGIELAAEYVTRWNNQLEQWSGRPEQVSEESIAAFEESTWEDLNSEQELTPRQQLIQREIKAKNFSNLNGKARGIQTQYKTERRVKQFNEDVMGFSRQMEQAMHDPANPLDPADAVDHWNAFVQEAGPTFFADLDISEDGTIPSTKASGNQLIDKLRDDFIRASVVNENLTPEQRTAAVMKSSNPNLLFEEMSRAHPTLFSPSFHNQENLNILSNFANGDGEMNAKSTKWLNKVMEDGGFMSLSGTVSMSDKGLKLLDNWAVTEYLPGQAQASAARESANTASFSLPDGTSQDMTLSSLKALKDRPALHHGDKQAGKAYSKAYEDYLADPVSYWYSRDKYISQLVDTVGAVMDPESPFYDPKKQSLLNMEVAGAVYNKNRSFDRMSPVVKAWDKAEMKMASDVLDKNVASLQYSAANDSYLNLGETATEVIGFFSEANYAANPELFQSYIDQTKDEGNKSFIKALYAIAPADGADDSTQRAFVETELLRRKGDLPADHSTLSKDIASDFVDDMELSAMYSFDDNPSAAGHIANTVVREVMGRKGYSFLDDDATAAEKLQYVRDNVHKTLAMRSLRSDYNGSVLVDNSGLKAFPKRAGKLRLTSSGRLVPQEAEDDLLSQDQQQRILIQKAPTLAVEEYKKTIELYGDASVMLAPNFNPELLEGAPKYSYADLNFMRNIVDTGQGSANEALKALWIDRAEKISVDPVSEGLTVSSMNQYNEPVAWLRNSGKHSDNNMVITSFQEMALYETLVGGLDSAANDVLGKSKLQNLERRTSAVARDAMVKKFDDLVDLRGSGGQFFEAHMNPMSGRKLPWFRIGGNMEDKLLLDQKQVAENIFGESLSLNFDSVLRRPSETVSEKRGADVSDKVVKLFKGGTIQVINPGARQLTLSPFSDAAAHIDKEGFMVAKLDGPQGSTAYGYAITPEEDEPAVGRPHFPFKSTGGDFPEETHISEVEAEYIEKSKNSGDTFYAWRGYSPESKDYWAVFMTVDDKGEMTPEIIVVDEETDEPFEKRHFNNYSAYFSNLTGMPL